MATLRAPCTYHKVTTHGIMVCLAYEQTKKIRITWAVFLCAQDDRYNSNL